MNPPAASSFELAVTWNPDDGSLVHRLANPADGAAPGHEWPANGHELVTASADPDCAVREQLPRIGSNNRASPMRERCNGRVASLPPWTVIWLHER